MKKKLKGKKVATVTVTKAKAGKNYALAFVKTMVAVADNLSAGALAALAAHLYLGDGDSTIDFVLYLAFAVLTLFSVWANKKLSDASN